jgi:hypothetical protein
MQPRKSRFLFPLVVILLLAGAFGARANVTELYQIHAAYFFNFIKFTSWPAQADPGQPLDIRVLDSPKIAEAVSNAPEQVIHGRPIVVRNCVSIDDLAGAEAVFLPAQSAKRLSAEDWMKFGPETLVVSDFSETLEKGGTIQLVTRAGKIRFAINLGRATGLNISSKLLRLASEVRE